MRDLQSVSVATDCISKNHEIRATLISHKILGGGGGKGGNGGSGGSFQMLHLHQR